jgi:hypothetical protein
MSFSTFGPIRRSVIRCSVFFDLLSFGVRSFGVRKFGVVIRRCHSASRLSASRLSAFGHSAFGHSASRLSAFSRWIRFSGHFHKNRYFRITVDHRGHLTFIRHYCIHTRELQYICTLAAIKNTQTQHSLMAAARFYCTVQCLGGCCVYVL